MKVVFLEDVAGVAQGGDVKDVKNGFARNYLIPKGYAVPATHNALQRVRQYSEQAEKARVKLLQDMRELSDSLSGVQVRVEMRAGASGQLYGSVTNAIIADRLSEISDREIDRRSIEIQDPIRQLGSFDVKIRLHPEVEANIDVLVHPTGIDADEWLKSLADDDDPAPEPTADANAQPDAPAATASADAQNADANADDASDAQADPAPASNADVDPEQPVQ